MAQRFLPGDETFYASDSPQHSFSAVFEDDGETGYLYAYDRMREADPILDALHIYNVHNVVDREIESDVEILWSEDGLKALLLLNDYPHAVLDFEARKGYCRTNFPPPTGDWRADAREPWSEEFVRPFRL